MSQRKHCHVQCMSCRKQPLLTSTQASPLLARAILYGTICTAPGSAHTTSVAAAHCSQLLAHLGLLGRLGVVKFPADEALRGKHGVGGVCHRLHSRHAASRAALRFLECTSRRCCLCISIDRDPQVQRAQPGESSKLPAASSELFSAAWPSRLTCRLAGSPTRRSPLSVKATTDGVVRAPSAFSMTLGVCASHHHLSVLQCARAALCCMRAHTLPSITATQELVVPRSIPIISFPADLRALELQHLICVDAGQLWRVPQQSLQQQCADLT